MSLLDKLKSIAPKIREIVDAYNAGKEIQENQKREYGWQRPRDSFDPFPPGNARPPYYQTRQESDAAAKMIADVFNELEESYEKAIISLKTICELSESENDGNRRKMLLMHLEATRTLKELGEKQ